MKEDFEVIWKRILDNQGKNFITISGISFTYKIGENDKFIPSIPKKVPDSSDKKNLKKAYSEWPKEKPSHFSDSIIAPSYVWGILNDDRIVYKD